MAYTGTVDLISGIRPMNNGSFALVDAKDVRVTDDERLDAALAATVRFDKDQGLTDAQKERARENIGAGQVDPTLSNEGMAADAKATGDVISGLKDDLNYDKSATPEMFHGVGDGQEDDSDALEAAIATGKRVFCCNTYVITRKIQIKTGIEGGGTIIFRGDGCFTFSKGSTITNLTFKTNSKLIDFTCTDVGSESEPNIHLGVLISNINIVCETGAGTLFDIKAVRYGFFNIVLKNINVTGICQKAIRIYVQPDTPGAWITQIYFIDCMLGMPMKAVEVTKGDTFSFERITTQAGSHNMNNLMYEFVEGRRMRLIDCMDWDWPYNSSAKIYSFTNCQECILIGNSRPIENYVNTAKEFYDTFSVIQASSGFSPQKYNVSNILINKDALNHDYFFGDDEIKGSAMFPLYGTANGSLGSFIRVVHNQAGWHGYKSYDVGINADGKIKSRLRVYDTNQGLDGQGHQYTKWGEWNTYSNDANILDLLKRVLVTAFPDYEPIQTVSNPYILEISDGKINQPLIDVSIRLTQPIGDEQPSPNNPITFQEISEVTLTHNTITNYTETLPSGTYGGMFDFTEGKYTNDMIKIDLGAYTWKKDAAYNRFYTMDAYALIAKPSNNNSIVEGNVCEVYRVVTDNQTSGSTYNYSIGISNQGRLDIRDERFSDPEDLKSYLSGKYALFKAINSTVVDDYEPTPIIMLNGMNVFECDEGTILVSYIENLESYISYIVDEAYQLI